MSGIKYYALRDGEELPEEFVVIRHIDGEPKFIASYINTNYLDYENGVLLKMHERNDVLRAENAKLTELAKWMYQVMDMSCAVHYPHEPAPVSIQTLNRAEKELQALGIEVPE